MVITSEQNQRIKDIVKLQDKKYREREGKFTIETYYPVLYALESAFEVETLFICPKLYKNETEASQVVTAAQHKNIEIVEVTANVFEKMAYVKSYDGLLAVAKTHENKLDEYVPPKNGLFLILEAIEQVSDLGTLIRLADNTGTTAVIICNERTDIFNPGVIRSSIGTVLTMPIYNASSADEVLEWCQKYGIETLATTPHTTTEYTQENMTGPVAIVMGNEYTGISDVWMNHADIQILIPMLGKSNSLSVVSSAAIVLYEAVRQRRTVTR